MTKRQAQTHALARAAATLYNGISACLPEFHPDASKEDVEKVKVCLEQIADQLYERAERLANRSGLTVQKYVGDVVPQEQDR